MSKYTTEVRYICESAVGLTESKGFNDIQNIITSAAPKVFNFDFPIFDEAYRLPLEIKILRHFYTREICEETVGLWKLRLCDKLNVIMPYYNKMYRSELLEFNPFYDVDLIRTHTRENEGSETRSNNGREDITDSGTRSRTEVLDSDTTTTNTNTGSVTKNETTNETSTGNSEGTKWDLYSDTPQGGINGITNDNDSVANNTYLTNARKNTDNVSGSSSVNGSAIEQQQTTVTDNGIGSVDSTVNENETNSKTGNRVTSENGATQLTSTEDYTEHVSGKQGAISYSKMLEEFRQTFLNIDRMILDELNDLFFGLW